MAFLVQPTLPSTRNSSSKVRVSTRAVADGVISVSRRRRVYEFLSATSKTPSSTASDSATAHVSAPASASPNGIPEDIADPNQVRDQLISRMKQREDAIKADAAKKQALWQAELDALRSISLQPSPTDSSPAPAKPSLTPSTSDVASKSSQGAEAKPAAPSAVAAPPPASTTPSSAKPIASSVAAPAASPPSETAPTPTQAASAPAQEPTAAAASVSDLYGPPPSKDGSDESRAWDLQNLVEGVREAVEDVREAVEDAVDDMRDAVEDVVEGAIEAFDHDDKEETKKDEKAPEPVTKSKPKAASVAEESKQDRSIGEVIIDAIVEGVDAPEAESEKPAVDKSDLIELVDSGKVKNLTVTKLRRLLTQNGLKTSGRKAELIARLTSFAKAK